MACPVCGDAETAVVDVRVAHESDLKRLAGSTGTVETWPGVSGVASATTTGTRSPANRTTETGTRPNG